MPAGSWVKKRVLIVVRTYPVPAMHGVEVSCTAGVTDDGRWIRLFPVPYRFLDEDKRFSKYQWVELSAMKAPADLRPESFKLNDATIRIISSVSAAKAWRARKEKLAHLIRPSLCGIQREQRENGSPTLGLFKPTEIKQLVIEPTDPDWTPRQKLALSQQLLPFQAAPSKPLEKIPYDFRYQFCCAEPGCPGHDMTCFDWELGQSYRRWRREYGTGWEPKFRERYERDMISRFDTHFYVGTVHRHPGAWIIVGLFYPPRSADLPLFLSHARPGS